jgi:hypothetical protein
MGEANAPYSLTSEPGGTGTPVFGSRERPTLLLDERSGAPLVLINGVSQLAPRYDRSSKGRDWAWTCTNAVKQH